MSVLAGVLHTCHHRTQVQAWLRLAGHEPVPAIYGSSGDVTWDAADPMYSLDAAGVAAPHPARGQGKASEPRPGMIGAGPQRTVPTARDRIGRIDFTGRRVAP